MTRRGLVATLVYCGLCTSVVGSLGALLIPTMAEEFEVSRGSAQWVLTAALMVGAVATPVLGALADGPRRRRVLIATLALVLLGSVLAATAGTFAQLLVGRGLQGLTYGVIPMATATARAHVPRDKLRSAIAALSVTTVTGAGLSFPVTGPIVQVFSWHAALWAAVLFTGTALLAVLVTVPTGSSGPVPTRRLDRWGAAFLGGALATLLLAVSQGGHWEWASPQVLGLAGTALVLTAAWVRQELRVDRPLVDLGSLRAPPVWLANLTALWMGAMLFAGSSAVSQLVQTPVAAGYGFGLPLLAAGLALLPTSVGSKVSSRVVTWLRRRFATRVLLPVGPLLMGLDLALLASFHDRLWHVLLALTLQGLAIGAAFVVMPALVLSAVPADQTGSAVALNQVLRTLGGSVGSAATGAVLLASTPVGQVLPREDGYAVVFLGTAIGSLALAAVLVIGLALTRQRVRLTTSAT